MRQTRTSGLKCGQLSNCIVQTLDLVNLLASGAMPLGLLWLWLCGRSQHLLQFGTSFTWGHNTSFALPQEESFTFCSVLCPCCASIVFVVSRAGSTTSQRSVFNSLFLTSSLFKKWCWSQLPSWLQIVEKSSRVETGLVRTDPDSLTISVGILIETNLFLHANVFLIGRKRGRQSQCPNPRPFSARRWS